MARYIEQHDPVGGIIALLDKHHLLNARKTVLLPALAAYRRGELALFSSAVAVQIEGIFEDACHLSGVSLDELRIATLIPKLDALLWRGHVQIDYPYYAFKFPILRNRVAHGRLVTKAPSERHTCCCSISLMLVVLSSNIPVHRTRSWGYYNDRERRSRRLPRRLSSLYSLPKRTGKNRTNSTS
jgi:hypothetical protein